MEYERRLNMGTECKDVPNQRKLQMQTSRVQRQIRFWEFAHRGGLDLKPSH